MVVLKTGCVDIFVDWDDGMREDENCFGSLENFELGSIHE